MATNSSRPIAQTRADVTFRLLLASRRWRRTANEVLRDFDLSDATALPLAMIARSDGGLRQCDLADALGIEGPSLVRLLDQLCRLGLVRRVEDAGDRRAKTLHLTDRGQEAVATIDGVLARLRRDMLAGAEPADLEACLRVFACLEAATSLAAEVA